MPIKRSELYDVRGGVEEDFNFIMATFLRGLYYGKSAFSPMLKDTFMKNYNKILVSLLASPNVKVKVVCLKDDSNTVLAYSILNQDETTLHWVFTRQSWRNIGLAKALVPPSVTTCTHLTQLGTNILKVKKSIVFDPFKLNN